MLGKGKFFNLKVIKKLHLVFIIIFFYFFLINISYANLQEKLINKLIETKNLSFNFIQRIDDKEEIGNCFIKYPLLMKCDYEGDKKKSIISNGKTVAIIKKKYKKIYYYPIETTPLFTLLKKKKILQIIKESKPSKINLETIEYEIAAKNSKILKIIFDKNSHELKGWETEDAYSNKVIFLIINLKTNISIEENLFKIPNEKNL